MMWLIISLLIILFTIVICLFFAGAGRLNREIEDMYCEDLKNLKKQGIIK